ncbi:ferredoxin [Ferrithrix thermotolerans DSM 19514]|jgi:ferredoxin|uniref:Ferredoxin n=1 Tax=Ferrithrix thermotolerans DSM 19514 TaxID=1121881 RepID=A0A1M4VV40_9ACTN|nr:ferredoxin [Ferrithrix thermotolerans]SHE72797.1 ferredoxin [Ferrithrix thermotolerans DSM 19514]
MKIEVDFDKCQSNAVCMQIAPSIFEVREDGFLYILNESPDNSMRSIVEKAVASCPTQAIKIV